MPNNNLYTEVNIDQIVADFGEYYINEGQNMENLHNVPFEELGTMSAFTIVPTNNTQLREGNVEFTSVLQQYQEEFTPKGSMTVKPRTIQLFQMKIDQYIRPAKIQRSWVAFLATNKATVDEWPLVRYIFEVYLAGQSKEDMEMYAMYNGVFEEPEEGQPGDADKVMDGINKQFQEFVDAGDLAATVSGSVPSDPVLFVTYCENLIKGIEERHRYTPKELNMNRTFRDRYREGVNLKYNGYYTQQQNTLSMLNWDNVTITGRASMMGKNRIWTSPKSNCIMGVKGFENVNAFELEREDRKLKAWTDWWCGVGFINPDLIWMNDQN